MKSNPILGCAMNKRFEFKVEELSSLLTDWELCFICQKITREKLTCPADYPGTNKGVKGVGYIIRWSTTLKNLRK